jgi:YidC/Oxa1 family membrane protein insertase
MESQRSFFAIGLVLVTFLLWTEWQQDYGPQPTNVTPEVQQSNGTDVVPKSDIITSSNSDVPSSDTAAESASIANAQLIDVYTDVLHLQIDTKGGDIVHAELLQHKVDLDSEQPFVLLRRENGFNYIAQSGLIGRDGPDANRQGRPVYSVDSKRYELSSEQITVPLTWTDGNGFKVTKVFTFNRGKYDVEVEYQVDNQTTENTQVQLYAQLKQSATEGEGSMMMPTYRGAAYSTQETRYKKYDFEEIAEANLNKSTLGGWIANIQHYFVSAWVPSSETTNQIYSRSMANNAIIGIKTPAIEVAANSSAAIKATLFVGPKIQDALEQVHESLHLTVDYGWLWFISLPLFDILNWFHGLVGNWGLAIILITLVVKGIMYPLTKAQYTSMAKMRLIQPKMLSLRERYGDDRQKMSQAMMELYRKEKVNPVGGCLPLLLQMPIFLALYWVLLESVELRHAPFALWIDDLSAADPYYVLPILMGASMWLLQKMTPMTIQDPMQQKVMMWMPVFMTIFFIWFPAGLVLYWLLSNVVTIVQAKMIYSALDKKGLGHKKT